MSAKADSIRAKFVSYQAAGKAVSVTHVRVTTQYNAETMRASTLEALQRAPAVITASHVKGVDGVLRQVGRVFLIAGAALRVAPVTGDIIRFGGADLKIVAVAAVAPAGEALLYKISVSDQ